MARKTRREKSEGAEPGPASDGLRRRTPMDGDVRKPSGTAPLETPPEHTPRPRIAGVELPFGSAASFGLLAGGHLLCAIGFSALQEKVFRIPGFVYSEYITLVQMLSYSACAFAEMAAVERRILPRAPLSKYALLSAFTFGGNSLTNHALMYLDYATRIVFKSARVIPVMLFERLIQGKRHSTFAYASAGMLVVGIALFTLGDAAALPSFNPMGVLLIVLALSLDAITCNFEEGSLFTGKHHNGTLYGHERCSQAEVIAFSMPMSAVWSLCSCIGGGELQPAIGHSIVHLTTTPLIVLSSVLGYLSIAFVLSLIKHFGASETEIVKSLRKVLSIVTSFVLYSKPVNWKYCAGFAMMLISIYFTVEQRRRKEAGKTSPAPTSLGTKGNADGLASDANYRK